MTFRKIAIAGQCRSCRRGKEDWISIASDRAHERGSSGYFSADLQRMIGSAERICCNRRNAWNCKAVMRISQGIYKRSPCKACANFGTSTIVVLKIGTSFVCTLFLRGRFTHFYHDASPNKFNLCCTRSEERRIAGSSFPFSSFNVISTALLTSG